MADDIRTAVSERANSLLDGKSHIKLLEAGCGSASHVRLKARAHVVGIDISKDQLDRNAVVQEKILGDLQVYPLPKKEFDVAVCWMVLEHLSRPKDALLNMFSALKPQGILILGFPNLLSFKGVVTKLTPYWFHELFYKVMKYSSHPFPTYLRAAIAPENVMRLAVENGFSVQFCRLEEGGQSKRVRNRFRFMNIAFSVADAIVRVLTFGKIRSILLDACFLILRSDGTPNHDIHELVPQQSTARSPFSR